MIKAILIRCAPVLMGVFILPLTSLSQAKWINVDSDYGPLPSTVQVCKTNDSLDGKPFIAYYFKAPLKDKALGFTADTTFHRRFTPKEFYNKNAQPLAVVNCTFFNFDKHQNLNLVIKDGKLVAHNIHTIPMRGKDTFQYRHPLAGAIGIDKKGNADVAWTITDSSKRFAYASQVPVTKPIKDSLLKASSKYLKENSNAFSGDSSIGFSKLHFKKWKMQTAVGGGPVLVQDGHIKITNDEEMKFAGKAINDKHPRTAMGYTKDGYLIILVIQGRFPGIAEGATLVQEAKILIDLGCIEALNLDGGGSSCLLINGKETIKPSDKGEERPVPSVFLIKVIAQK